MEREQALAIVEPKLTPKRYKHTIGVMETAIHLANKYGANVKQAELAAIFHDYAKFRDLDELAAIIRDGPFPADLLQYSEELWHAPAGMYLVELEVGIEDPEVLMAIRYHTSGRIGMSLLEKVIYVADFIEPNRKFPGVEQGRELAETDLDEALCYAMSHTIQYLASRHEPIYPVTLAAYNDIAMTLKLREENNQ